MEEAWKHTYNSLTSTVETVGKHDLIRSVTVATYSIRISNVTHVQYRELVVAKQLKDAICPYIRRLVVFTAWGNDNTLLGDYLTMTLAVVQSIPRYTENNEWEALIHGLIWNGSLAAQ